MAADELTTPAQLLQKIITTSAGMVLGVVIVWTVATVANLQERLSVMESRNYPPRYITEKIKFLDEEQRRCQMQIDRLEERHHDIRAKSLKPYSYMPNDGSEKG